MKFHNRKDELHESNLLKNAMPSMIAPTGRCRVGKTELYRVLMFDADQIANYRSE
ncbi:MAG: hypothetical protein HF976_14850 [ANME-2 cluster archaeon]|nr:hypothetical protein [ANME-2 cluster archaeon]MBC2702654.1 hypothetical protein [ANME-2 cluster archaeon]MBC2706809.1 hypothetical protein [ANME-2 cluster archaeon]